MWEIKKFNSGEYNVKLTERFEGDTIKWDWFQNRDIMIPLLQADAIFSQYGPRDLILECNYLPYSRQDRVFEVGNGIPVHLGLDLISCPFTLIRVMGIHNINIANTRGQNWTQHGLTIDNHRLILTYDCDLYEAAITPTYNIIFPDSNAKNHYAFHSPKDAAWGSFSKIRDSISGEPSLELTIQQNINKDIPFLICDDICDGGRTFVKCANKLKELYGAEIKIELMIYHAFMTHGLDDLKASGISNIHIINPDSYGYIMDKFPNEGDYIQYRNIEFDLIIGEELTNV